MLVILYKILVEYPRKFEYAKIYEVPDLFLQKMFTKLKGRAQRKSRRMSRYANLHLGRIHGVTVCI